MTSTIPPVTPPAWATLLTGVRPERHGIFGFMEGMLFADTRKDVLARSRPVSSLSLTRKSVVEFLGDAGRRVMLINVPMSYPPRPVNGIVVSGLMTPSDASDFTWPAELAEELRDYVIDVTPSADRLERGRVLASYDPERLLGDCTCMVKTRGENACRLGKAHPFDFGLVVFTSPDRIFHRLWPAVTAFTRSDAPGGPLESLLRDFFVQLDRSLGELVDAFPDASVMVASDHGFGPCAERMVYPDVWLEEKGFLVRRGRSAERSGRRPRRSIRGTVRGALEKLLPGGLAARIVSTGRDRQTRLLESLDRERSVACFASLDNARFGGIRLLDEAKSRLGGGDEAALVLEIIASLREMHDPETDEPLLAGAWRREEVFPDARVDFLPEIVMEFRPRYAGRTDPDADSLLGGPLAPGGGTHDIDGMFVLAGEPVRPLGEVSAMHLADVAPTVLYLSDLAVPATMQGKPPLGLFAQEHVKEHPLRRSPVGRAETDGATGPHGAYTPEQEKSVREQLRELGYLE
jgi:predicted AlkP superfamily phosphohydrolase/phosphomutase